MDMAVKVPNADLFQQGTDRERWILEAQTWIELGLHPNIVTCWFIHQHERLPLLFLDYLQGGSLKERIERNRLGAPIEWPVFLDIAIQVCDGLSHAHERKLVHRDVKPANLLMDQEGRVCVTDFGLVKTQSPVGPAEIPFEANVGALRASLLQTPGNLALSQSQGLTSTGRICGTPHYASPEQWMQARDIGPQADIYSLGVTLIELGTGRLPFEGSGPEALTQVLLGHLQETPPDPRGFRADLPEPLAELLLHCLAKAPEDRPTSAVEVRNRLTRIYEEVAAQPYPRLRPEPALQQADALNNKAVSFFNLGKEREALAAWVQAARLDPVHPESVYNRSMLQWKQAQLAPTEVLDRLSRVKSAVTRGGAYLGYAEMRLGRYDRAALELECALKDPDVARTPAVWRNLGDAWLAQQSFDQAESAYQRSFELNPEDEITQQRLAMVAEHSRCFQGECIFPAQNSAEICQLPGRAHALDLDDSMVVCAYESSLTAFPLVGDGRGGPIDSASKRGALFWRGWRAPRLWDIRVGSKLRRLQLVPRLSLVAALDSPGHGTWFTNDGSEHMRLEANECLFDIRNELAVGGNDEVHIYDLAEGKRLRSLQSHKQPVRCAVMTTDGRRVLTGGADGTARLWDTETGRCMQTLSGHKDALTALALSSDGSFGVTGSRDAVACVWLLETGECFGQFESLPGEVCSIHISALGGPTAVNCRVGEGFTTVLLDFGQKVQVAQIPGWSQLTPDGLLLTLNVATGDGGVDIRSASTLSWQRSLACAPSFLVPSCSPDGRRLACAGTGTEVWIHELSERHRSYPSNLQLTRARSYEHLQMARQRFDAHRTRCTEHMEREEYQQAYTELLQARQQEGFYRSPEALALLQRLLTRLPRGALRSVWEHRSFRISEGERITTARLMPRDEQVLVTAGKLLKLYDLQSGCCLRGFPGHADVICDLDLGPSGAYALTAGRDRSLRLWSMETGEHIKRVTLPEAPFRVRMLSKERAIVLMMDHTIAGVSLTEYTVSNITPVKGSNLLEVGNHQKWALLGGEGDVYLWDVGKRKIRWRQRQPVPLTGLHLHGNAPYAWIASDDNSISLWDLESSRRLRKLVGHKHRINRLVCSDDGLCLISASEDGEILIWDMNQEHPMQRLTGTWGQVVALEISPDARRLLSVGTDQVLRLWELDWELIQEQPGSLMKLFPPLPWWRRKLFSKS